MFVWGKKKLEILSDSNLSLEKRKKYLKRFKYMLGSEIKELSNEELLKYLYKSDLDMEVKKLIHDHIYNMSIRLFNDESKRRFNELKRIFSEKYVSEGLLRSDICVDEFKEIIIDKVYGTDIGKILSKGTMGLAKKKVVIDLKVNEYDVDKILRNNLSDDVVDYILETKLNGNNGYKVGYCLMDEDIPAAVKDRIIERSVTAENIFTVNGCQHGKRAINVLVARKDLVEQCFETASGEVLLKFFSEYGVPKEFCDKLLSEKRDVVIDAIKKAKKSDLLHHLRYGNFAEVCELIYEYRNDTCYDIATSLKQYELLGILNRSKIPDNFKNMIYAERKDDVLSAISELTLEDARRYYLDKYSGMPQHIQRIIFNHFYDEICEWVMNIDERDIQDQISYKCDCPDICKLIIKLRCDDKKAFKLLSTISGNHPLASYILDAKKEAITNHIMSLGVDELFKLEGLCITDDILTQIVLQNKDYIVSVIETLDSDKKFTLLNDKDIKGAFKQLLLGNFGIEGLDIGECLALLNKGNAEVLIYHFHDIKDFINQSGISFKSLLQYGAGSKKHSEWLVQLSEIISNGYQEDFNKCREYFFNNYYDGLLEKENAVALISSFLEIIDNYSKYRELMDDLCSNNTVLSEDDKMNLRFLFNTKVSGEFDVPKTLGELKEFKKNLYKDYIDRINNEELSEEEIKKIFNDLLFGDSQIILQSIGGTGALRTLKKDNCNSLDIANLIDEVILYGRVIEMVNDSNNTLGLKKILEHVFSDVDTLTKFQNLFLDFTDKVEKLYELDSKYNLTSLDEARRLGCIDKVLSEKYGGEVFDFKDKNYALYAHVMSTRESVEDLLNGSSNGSQNFISVSPISYRGQTYYYYRDEYIFLYDKIPTGSFIRSSISNMGSNGYIRKNSSEVDGKGHAIQRGILESSSSTDNNPEALLYREGLKPCGIALPGGRVPSNGELEIHRKYGIPFIVTQDVSTSIEDVKYIFNGSVTGEKRDVRKKELEDIIEVLRPNLSISKESDEYTGREVAIFTDCHSMYEPTLAVLEDIRRHGITEIYSLGDNVGLGPNPCEVFDLLEEYGVVSVAGNSEYYNTLGIEPFTYFYDAKKRSQEWTTSKLGRERVKKMEVYPASIDLVLGGERLALCHFANDVRWDFHEHSTHTYQADFESGHASEQFLYTNSDECKKKVSNCITSKKKGDKSARGYISSKENPLFDGKMVTDYDAIIQGHVHFDMEDEIEDTKIHTLRAVGMGHKGERVDTACYYVFKEKKDGSFDKVKRNVRFNRDNMMASIHNSDLPNKEAILRYVK